MADKGLNIHRTGETSRRRVPAEDGRRRMIRQNIVPFHVDDAQREDLLDGHDAGIIEEGLAPVVTKKTTKKSDEKLEKLVDKFLSNVFGQEALERDDFFHSELVEPIARAVAILKIQKEREYPEQSSELLTLAQKAQQELKALDEAEDFSRLKLQDFFEKYKRDLASLLAYNNDNNMSQEETTPPSAERIAPAELVPASPAEVAAETAEKIDQVAAAAVVSAPEVAPAFEKLAAETKAEIDLVYDPETDRFFNIKSGAEVKPNELDPAKEIEPNFELVDTPGTILKKVKPFPDNLPATQKIFGDNLPATQKNLGPEEAQFEVLPNDDKKDDVVQPPKGPEGPKPETDPSLSKKRVDFWTELHKRGNVWSKGRFLGITKQNQGKLDDFEKIRAEYSETQAKELEAKLKLFVAGLDPKLSEVDKNFAFTQEYMKLKKAEDEEIDTVAKGLGVKGMDKFKSFWKRTALKRGAFGAGLWALGAVTGGMGFLAAKVGLSSLGAYMTAESVLDTRTKTLGQKGLIDELKNTGFKRGEKAKITEKDKDEAIEKLMTDKYSVEDLEKEWSHLRVLSLDKNKGIKEAGRFGAEQAPLVEAIQEVYYYKKAQQLAAEMITSENPEIPKAVSLASFLTSENNATQAATSEQDKSRMKAIARNVTAAGIGLTVGWLASQRVLDAVDPTTPEVAPIVPLPVEEISTVEIPDGLIGKGDTVWGMVKEHLAKSVTGWDKLNPAEQTRYIDYFENKVVANPSAFGLTDPDHLKEGTNIHWGDLFADKNLDEGMKFVKTLTPEQMQNIVENNKILSEAAKHGVEITSKNVNDVIGDIRAQGLEQYLAEHGHGAAQAAAENAQDIAAGDMAEGLEAGDAIDTATEAGQASTENTETLEDMGGSEKVYAFTHDQGPYDANILKMAQRMGELAPETYNGLVNEVVNKVFESSAEVQQQFLQDLNPEDFTPDNNKAEVFLKVLQESTKLPQIDSLGQLEKMIDAFDSLADSTDLPGKEFAPRILNVDGADEPVYVFAKKVGGKVFGLFGEPKYVIDYFGPKPLIVSEQVMFGYLNPRA